MLLCDQQRAARLGTSDALRRSRECRFRDVASTEKASTYLAGVACALALVLCPLLALERVTSSGVTVLGVDIPARPLPAVACVAGLQHALPHDGSGFLNMTHRRIPPRRSSIDVFDPANLPQTSPDECFQRCERSGDRGL